MTDDQETPTRTGTNEVDRAIYRLLRGVGYTDDEMDEMGDTDALAAVGLAVDAYRQLRADFDNLAAELATMRAVARSNGRSVAILTAVLDRVEQLTVNTDGDNLDDIVEIPVGEIRRALHEPIPGTAPADTSPDRDCVYLDVRDEQMTVTQTTGRPIAVAVNGEVVAVPDRVRTTIELTLAGSSRRAQERPCFDCGRHEADHVDGRCGAYRPAAEPA